MLQQTKISLRGGQTAGFNGHPPLGVNATRTFDVSPVECWGFNGHPPLGVNATGCKTRVRMRGLLRFQRAPTLGGECYTAYPLNQWTEKEVRFNGHPPLGVNATVVCVALSRWLFDRFNGHPPLGVNATV